MKICFWGVGGVGGYFGALLTKRFKNEHEIYFIARGKHKDEICANGLTLKKSGGEEIINVMPDKCSEHIENIPICDIIIVSVKSYDLDTAVKEISKISHNKTIILPLLNGVDIYERIKNNLTSGIVLPSCVYVGTHIESPGVIFQKGGSCKILFGSDPEFPNTNLDGLKNLFTEASINFEQMENVYISIWSKYIFIAAYGLITATYNKTIGEVLNDPELGTKTKAIMNEVDTIANRLEIPLGPNIIENSFLKAKDFPFETKTSFHRDVESKGKINEGESFGGTIIRLGKKLNIPVPITETVYADFLNSIS